MALWTKAGLCGESSLSEQSLPRTLSWLKNSLLLLRSQQLNKIREICEICGYTPLRNLRQIFNQKRSYLPAKIS